MTFTSQAQIWAAQAGQMDFERLFQEHWSRVYGVLLRLVGDPAEAEDLALEAFWRLYRQPPARPENLAGWLYRVATRLGYNALRSNQRRQRYEATAGQEALQTAAGPDPAAALEQAQLRAQVRQALQGMSPRAAQVLVLRQAGLSYAELAAALEVAPGSVGTLLARAEREFAAQFEKIGR